MNIIEKDLKNSCYLQWHGRIFCDEKGVHFFYTASGFDICFSGSKLFAIFETSYEEYNKRPFLTVNIRHEKEVQTFTVELKNGRHKVQLIDLPDGIYNVEIRKRSESLMSPTILSQISADGTFQQIKATSAKKKIEWIGDSLVCGFGNLGKKPEEVFTTEKEDGMQSFASIASKYMNVDYQVVAVSGIGIYKSFYAEVTMPCIYEQLDIYNNNPYDFSYKPDVIVINLGTNDHNYMKFLESKSLHYEQIAFKNAYIKFLNQVSSKNIKAHILLISQGKRHSHVDLMIEKVYDETILPHVHHLRISDVRLEDGMGSQYHPTIITHKRWGIEIANKLKLILEHEEKE